MSKVLDGAKGFYSPDWLHNLWGTVQNENEGPLGKRKFKTLTVVL